MSGYGAAGRDFMLHGPGMGQIEAYLLIVVLALPGVRLGLSAAEPDVPQPHAGRDAAARLGGDQSGACRRCCRRFSVASYLRHLMPVSVPAKAFLRC